MAKIGCELDALTSKGLLASGESTRRQCIHLIKALSYEPHMFDTAAGLQARILVAEPLDGRQKPAHDAFAELFRLHLSGTQAAPKQRREFVAKLAKSCDPNMHRCASVALRALLTTRGFVSVSNFDFGARSRGWGWQPKLHGDIWDWYSCAIDLAVELSADLDDTRDILAGSVVELWQFDACHESLDRAAAAFVKVKPWIAGWIAFRALLRLGGKNMADPVRERLETIIKRLAPPDLLNRARALVFNRGTDGWDVADGEPDDGDPVTAWHKASQMAQHVSRLLVQEPELRHEFFAELFTEPQAHRAFECGRGLAEGASDLDEIWRELASQFEAPDHPRNMVTLAGFIYEAHRRDAGFVQLTLEAAIESPKLAPALPYLQAQVGIDEHGIARLRYAIKKGAVEAHNFVSIANGMVGDSPPEALGALLLDIAGLANGVEVALDILHMHFHCDPEAGRPRDPSLIAVGRDLLRRVEFSDRATLSDYGLATVIRVCCSGSEGDALAREICAHIRRAMETIYVSHHDLRYVLKALFETQPLAALDIFLVPRPTSLNPRLFEAELGSSTPIDTMDPVVLRQWAANDPATRYPLLGLAISMFEQKSGDEDSGISLLFLETLDHAPDKRAFLGDLLSRLRPSGGWSGSLADILTGRKDHLLTLRDGAHADVRQWIDDIQPRLDLWIQEERKRDREGEQSFE